MVAPLGRHRLERRAHQEDGGGQARQHGVLAQGHAAGDLQVDQLVVEGLGRHQAPHPGLPAGRIVRGRNAQPVQVAGQPGHVIVEAEQAPAIDRQGLVDAVAQQKPRSRTDTRAWDRGSSSPSRSQT
jgi:hypothetical protein